jgi:uncharacterized protein (TIGR02594 family)
MSKGVSLVQEGLHQLGYEPGPIDGTYGPKTAAALMAAGMAGFAPANAVVPPIATSELPWIEEGLAVLGWHEANDKARLSAWLKSGGKYLGDPAALPWCGDFAETCIELALPGEPMPGPLGANPFFAQNWAAFGIATAPTRGAVVAFKWSASSGHVGFLMGQHGSNYVVLGGNQSNKVSIAEFPKASAIATRWPSTVPVRPIGLPAMTAAEVITGIAATR